MDRLHHMKEKLINCVQCQMTDLDKVSTKELGEAIDMIKDLSEAIYYCTITKAMEGGDDYEYPEWDYYRDVDKKGGRMYYDGNKGALRHVSPPTRPVSEGTGHVGHTERELPLSEIMRDHREGRSPISRKMYIESKEMHKDKGMSMQELEKYAQELTADIVEMIEEATPEEKQYLSNRITALAAKIK